MEICSKDTVSPGLIKFGFSSFVLSKILRGVLPIMFQPPGLSKEYILQNCSVIPTDPYGILTLGVSNLLALKDISVSPKNG